MNKSLKIFLISIAIATSGILLISWRQKASNLAAQFLDISEVGSNNGFSNAAFQEMMVKVGWKGGEAWCMYFAKAIYLKAFPNKAREIDRILTGSTQQSLQNARNNPDVFTVITDGRPQRGDIIIWQNINNPSTGHAGIAYKKQEGDTWYTVEGNTNLQKVQEGDGVMKQTRKLVIGTVEGNLKLVAFLRLKTTLF